MASAGRASAGRASWRSAVVAALRLIGQTVSGELVPALRAEADAAAGLALRTLPGQRQAFRRGLRLSMTRLWGRVERVTVDGIQAQFLLASKQVGELKLEVIGGRTDLLNRPDLFGSDQAQAIVAAREHAARVRQGRKLSTRVTLNARASERRIQALVDEAIRKGEGPAVVARRIRQYINPATPGGVSYAALRIARTELLAAHHERTLAEFRDSGMVTAVFWRVSPTHTGHDVCDELADGSPYGLDLVPARPHPFCMCWLDPVLADPDTLLADENGPQTPLEAI